jgi:hypothetical protein
MSPHVSCVCAHLSSVAAARVNAAAASPTPQRPDLALSLAQRARTH